MSLSNSLFNVATKKEEITWFYSFFIANDWLFNGSWSYGKVKTSSCESFIWQNNFDIVLLCLLILLCLLLSFLLREKLLFVVLQLFLQSLVFDFVLKYSFFVIFDFITHTLYLSLLLLQSLLINWNHALFLNRWLSLQNFL
jgi:hypothetical protein